MGRKNNNAGQPNRGAQITRRAKRRDSYEKFERRFVQAIDDPGMVLGPGSKNLNPVPGEIKTRTTVVVREMQVA